MKKIINFLKSLFSKAKYFVIRFVTPAVATVENIKKIVDNPLIDIVTGLIPGKLDDLVISRIRLYLPQVIKVLRISDECLKLELPNDIIKCAIEKLRTYTPDEKKVAYHSMASLLAQYLSDKKLSWSEAIHLAEMVYQDNFKK